MKNEPKVIYLNCYDEAETDPSYLPIEDDFDTLEGEYVLWSANKPCLSGNIKYVHHDDLIQFLRVNPKATSKDIIDYLEGI